MTSIRAWHIPLIVILAFFTVGGLNEVSATGEKIIAHYEKPHKVITPTTMYYDLTKIDLKIINIQVLPVDDTPGYTVDDADIVKVTVSITNNGSEYFVVADKMFELWIAESNKSKPKEFNVIDNFDTTYDDEFEVIYEKMNSRELFNECDQTIEGIEHNESLEFTLCYDILKTRTNGGVNLNSSKKYSLVMMDNQQATSCPNCKKIMLTKDWQSKTSQVIPAWISKLYGWREDGLISEQEVRKSLDYLIRKGIITINTKKSSDFLTLKNREFAKYQGILSEAYSKNIFTSAIQMIEYKPTERFSGIVCKKQNDVITLDADYTNDISEYNVIFFRLKIFDDSGDMSAEGLSKIVSIAPKSFRHLSVSVPATQNPKYCIVEVDSKFP